MQLPGGATFLDARTYQQLVWADLGDEGGGGAAGVADEVEAALEEARMAGTSDAGGCAIGISKGGLTKRVAA